MYPRYLRFTSAKPPAIDMEQLWNGLLLMTVSGILLVAEMYFGADETHNLLLGAAHMSGGGASYYFWLAVPTQRREDQPPEFI